MGDMAALSGLPYIPQMGCQCSQVPGTRPRRVGMPQPESASRPSLDMPAWSILPYILQKGLVVSRYMLQPTEHTSQVGLRGLAQIRQTMYLHRSLSLATVPAGRLHSCLKLQIANMYRAKEQLFALQGRTNYASLLRDSRTVPAGMLHFFTKPQICTVWVTTGFALQEH